MHRDVTLVDIKSSNKLKYLKLEESKLKTAKEVVIHFKKSFQLGDKNFVSYTLRLFASAQEELKKPTEKEKKHKNKGHKKAQKGKKQKKNSQKTQKREKRKKTIKRRKNEKK